MQPLAGGDKATHEASVDCLDWRQSPGVGRGAVARPALAETVGWEGTLCVATIRNLYLVSLLWALQREGAQVTGRSPVR